MIRRVKRAYAKEEVLGLMEPLVAQWFDSKFKELTEPQAYAVPLIHGKKNVIVSSPTGSGKTLTAFLSIINELMVLSRKKKLEDKIVEEEMDRLAGLLPARRSSWAKA